jgi:dTDP-4-amino-4,6-dideoxygalactose transaminase
VEGGALVTQDKKLADKIWLMKKFGHFGEDEYYCVGINAKNSEFHAAMGLCVLPKISEIIHSRKEVCQLYDEFLADLKFQTPMKTPGLEYNYAYYPIVFHSHHQMMAVREGLIKNQIVPRRYFYPSLNKLEFLNPNHCPVSEDIANRVLALPLYVGLTADEVSNICKIISGIVHDHAICHSFKT